MPKPLRQRDNPLSNGVRTCILLRIKRYVCSWLQQHCLQLYSLPIYIKSAVFGRCVLTRAIAN